MVQYLSPGVTWSEIDLTGVAPTIGLSTGAYVGMFDWGPVDKPITVSSQGALVNYFGKPSANLYKWHQATSFWCAANFLAYSETLQVVRTLSANCRNATTGVSGLLIKDPEDYELNYSDLNNFTVAGAANTYGMFAAKYPGARGNDIKISMFCASAASGNTAAWNAWPYKTEFQSKPTTSDFVLKSTGGSNLFDQMHIIVLDTKGTITGTANTVLEKFSYVSKCKNARNGDGSSNYYVDVLQSRSNWLYAINHAQNTTTQVRETVTWGNTLSQMATANVTSGDLEWTTPYQQSYYVYNFNTKGGMSDVPTRGNVEAAYAKFKNADVYDVGLMVMGHWPSEVSQYVVENVVDGGEFKDDPSYGIISQNGRKDCVVFVSPPAGLVGASATYFDSSPTGYVPGQESQNLINWRNGDNTVNSGMGVPGSSLTYGAENFNVDSNYVFVDTGWKRQYDPYNDIYRWLPLNPDIAGLTARTEFTNDAWWSPAGLNRGKIKNVTKLAWNPDKSARDQLYPLGINPVITLKGEGTVLFGDKMYTMKTSAFDRINVRRLFIYLEKVVTRASRYSLFEFNDEFTRAQFVALVEPILRDVKGRRGIYDYKVVCDESNNPPAIIDANRFVGDIYVKPARSINFIQLNFVAVRTGVSFSEIAAKF